MRITKKKIAFFLDEYIEDACKPPEQIENRFSDLYDKKSIVSELQAVLREIENIRTDKNLRRLIRFLLQIAEERANSQKRGKIINEDIAYGYQEMCNRVVFGDDGMITRVN